MSRGRTKDWCQNSRKGRSFAGGRRLDTGEKKFCLVYLSWGGGRLDAEELRLPLFRGIVYLLGTGERFVCPATCFSESKMSQREIMMMRWLLSAVATS